MVDYSLVLALSYFKEKQTKYLISELMEILGYTRSQMDKLLQELFSKEYIHYERDLICVTNKGYTFLISNNYDDISVNDEEFKTIRIKPETALPLDAPYVPKKFTKKYEG